MPALGEKSRKEDSRKFLRHQFGLANQSPNLILEIGKGLSASKLGVLGGRRPTKIKRPA